MHFEYSKKLIYREPSALRLHYASDGIYFALETKPVSVVQHEDAAPRASATAGHANLSI